MTEVDQLEVTVRRTQLVFWMFGAVVLIAALALVFFMRRPSDYTIEFIIPNDYRGVITLVGDSKLGVKPILKDNNVYVYEIPQSGILVLSDFHLFERWHKERGPLWRRPECPGRHSW
jgi:hypothetical protein